MHSLVYGAHLPAHMGLAALLTQLKMPWIPALSLTSHPPIEATTNLTVNGLAISAEMLFGGLLLILGSVVALRRSRR